ncbi:nucleic acid-binding, OB-fold protein [Artemisia annua]|uniref:Nucleic acid-binding, OB-fold protein n=1 Tax=Artemisia annua TaxID=35608 RepID=A0A2U1NI88_ARTAN|nr:nucleic acid-binding, OB-fold protein [Artemisia annua]
MEAYIRDLRPTDRDKVIEAKIYRSWMSRDPPDVTEKGYHAILLDKQLTLWDDLAKSFKKEEIDALQKPVLIAVSSCRINRYRNTLQLQSTPATYYYINPKIPELDQYLQEYRALFNINPPLQIVRHPYQDKEQEKNEKQDTFECVITSINTLREWYYPACTQCINKVEVHENAFNCKIHGPVELPDYRFNFKAYITDGTTTAMIAFFTPKADDFVGVKCNALVKSLENPDPKKIPAELQTIVGRKHIFQFHFNTSSKHKPPDFIFNEILDAPTAPPKIEATPSGSQAIEKASNLTECGSTSYTTTKLHAIVASPTEGPQQTQDSQGMPANTDTLESPDNIIIQKEAETGTATPPTPHMGMQTRSKIEDATRRTIKHPLFPKETAETKKKKS